MSAPDEIDLLALNNLADFCADAAWNSGFHDVAIIDNVEREVSPVERMMLIVSEVAEMLEAYRKDGNPASDYYDADGKPQGVASELADVIIRCFDYAGRYEIDLAFGVADKLAYNSGRARRHGKVL